jgi:hypothetical protein
VGTAVSAQTMLINTAVANKKVASKIPIRLIMGCLPSYKEQRIFFDVSKSLRLFQHNNIQQKYPNRYFVASQVTMR